MSGVAEAGAGYGVSRGGRSAYVYRSGGSGYAGASIQRGRRTYHRVYDGRRMWSGVTVRDRFGRSWTVYR